MARGALLHAYLCAPISAPPISSPPPTLPPPTPVTTVHRHPVVFPPLHPLPVDAQRQQKASQAAGGAVRRRVVLSQDGDSDA